MSGRGRKPRIGLILLTLAGIALASAGLATAVTMSVSAPVLAQSGIAVGTGSGQAGAATPGPADTASEAWEPMPVDPAIAGGGITDLTRGASTRVTVDVLGIPVSPGQAGALVAVVLSVPLVIAVAVLVAAPRPRRWWRRTVFRRQG